MYWSSAFALYIHSIPFRVSLGSPARLNIIFADVLCCARWLRNKSGERKEKELASVGIACMYVCVGALS